MFRQEPTSSFWAIQKYKNKINTIKMSSSLRMVSLA